MAHGEKESSKAHQILLAVLMRRVGSGTRAVMGWAHGWDMEWHRSRSAIRLAGYAERILRGNARG